MLIYVTFAGRIEECRSECLELNKYPIVRVHVKKETVHAGICRNLTNDLHIVYKSRVTPFQCNRTIGIWEHDEEDQEGIVDFKKPCPSAMQYNNSVLETCLIKS